MREYNLQHSFKSFLTSLYYSNKILPQLIITAEYNNVIRVIEEAKINLMTWWSQSGTRVCLVFIPSILVEPTHISKHILIVSLCGMSW